MQKTLALIKIIFIHSIESFFILCNIRQSFLSNVEVTWSIQVFKSYTRRASLHCNIFYLNSMVLRIYLLHSFSLEKICNNICISSFLDRKFFIHLNIKGWVEYISFHIIVKCTWRRESHRYQNKLFSSLIYNKMSNEFNVHHSDQDWEYNFEFFSLRTEIWKFKLKTIWVVASCFIWFK